VFAYLREGESKTLLVVGNLSAESASVALPDSLPLKAVDFLLSNGSARVTLDRSLDLEPYDAFIASLGQP
jgi:hypothetical protein